MVVVLILRTRTDESTRIVRVRQANSAEEVVTVQIVAPANTSICYAAAPVVLLTRTITFHLVLVIAGIPALTDSSEIHCEPRSIRAEA